MSIAFQALLFIISVVVIDGQLMNSTSEEPYIPIVQHIAGGEKTDSGEFSFMVALGWINDSGELKFNGGGVVIGAKMILTAAHTVYINGKLPDTVYIGGSPLSEVNDPYMSVFSTYTVQNATLFPKYNPNYPAYYDIAILEVTETIWFPSICLWKSPNLPTDIVTAIGYGLTEFAGSGSEKLLKVDLTVFPADFCEPFFKRQRKFIWGISEAHICAGDETGIKDTCQGDSGGPIMINHKNQMFAVGITSLGQACYGFPPAIYTKIYSYIGWITQVLESRGEALDQCVT
ncbi:serine protease snake-like [Episyrphus balteatus]|uniref:serine protease snake-like n=1 Tax=Episyrphus balteatus TaxID=286459 RepID=UPI00248586FD|nr:serine protease snake-like [Episyrphus balteatus]